MKKIIKSKFKTTENTECKLNCNACKHKMIYAGIIVAIVAIFCFMVLFGFYKTGFAVASPKNALQNSISLPTCNSINKSLEKNITNTEVNFFPNNCGNGTVDFGPANCENCYGLIYGDNGNTYIIRKENILEANKTLTRLQRVSFTASIDADGSKIAKDISVIKDSSCSLKLPDKCGNGLITINSLLTKTGKFDIYIRPDNQFEKALPADMTSAPGLFMQRKYNISPNPFDPRIQLQLKGGFYAYIYNTSKAQYDVKDICSYDTKLRVSYDIKLGNKGYYPDNITVIKDKNCYNQKDLYWKMINYMYN
ncbi:MAG: hypothetical protein V1824_00975 [archaeon]